MLLFLLPNGELQVKLSDFGIARLHSELYEYVFSEHSLNSPEMASAILNGNYVATVAFDCLKHNVYQMGLAIFNLYQTIGFRTTEEIAREPLDTNLVNDPVVRDILDLMLTLNPRERRQADEIYANAKVALDSNESFNLDAPKDVEPIKQSKWRCFFCFAA